MYSRIKSELSWRIWCVQCWWPTRKETWLIAVAAVLWLLLTSTANAQEVCPVNPKCFLRVINQMRQEAQERNEAMMKALYSPEAKAVTNALLDEGRMEAARAAAADFMYDQRMAQPRVTVVVVEDSGGSSPIGNAVGAIGAGLWMGSQ